MKFSIIPELLQSKGITFFDEKDIEVSICKESKFKYFSPFLEPFIVIDTFAIKTTKQEEIVYIDYDELKRINFVITSIKAKRRKWFNYQRVIYRIESSLNLTPGAKVLKLIPPNHKIQKDIANKRIRIIGPSAGYPRQSGGGPWISI